MSEGGEGGRYIHNIDVHPHTLYNTCTCTELQFPVSLGTCT